MMEGELKRLGLDVLAARVEHLGMTGSQDPQAFADLAAIVAELCRRLQALKAEANK